jgi:hypothetical protein
VHRTSREDRRRPFSRRHTPIRAAPPISWAGTVPLTSTGRPRVLAPVRLARAAERKLTTGLDGPGGLQRGRWHFPHGRSGRPGECFEREYGASRKHGRLMRRAQFAALRCDARSEVPPPGRVAVPETPQRALARSYRHPWNYLVKRFRAANGRVMGASSTWTSGLTSGRSDTCCTDDCLPTVIDLDHLPNLGRRADRRRRQYPDVLWRLGRRLRRHGRRRLRA